MTTITIPKQFLNQKIALVPAKEYEEFLNWKKTVKFFRPTNSDLKHLQKSRGNFAKKAYLNLKQLKDGLGIKN